MKSGSPSSGILRRSVPVTFVDGRQHDYWRVDEGRLRAALQAWFAGDLRAFDGLSITTGGTEFQRRVWAALRDIPAGETRSYGQLASQMIYPPGGWRRARRAAAA